MKIKTYQYIKICKNCRNVIKLNIPKGRPVGDFIKEIKSECPICGCDLGWNNES